MNVVELPGEPRRGGKVVDVTTPNPDQIKSHLAALPPSVRALLDSAPPQDDVPVGERSVPAAEFLEVLAEQVAAAQSGVEQWQLRTDQQGAGMLAGAWRSIVFGQAKAVLPPRRRAPDGAAG